MANRRWFIIAAVLVTAVALGFLVLPELREEKAAQLERAADVAEKRGTIVGRIDHVDANEIAGWAYAWDDPGTPANVDIYLDGNFLATVTASANRPSFAPQDPQNPINFRAFA